MKNPTKVQQLRKKYETTNISLVDLVRLFDTTKNKVLTGFMTDALIKECEQRSKTNNYYIEDYVMRQCSPDDQELLKILGHNPLIGSVVHRVHELFGEETRYYVDRFKKYWEENKLPTKDMTKYPDFESVKSVVDLLDIQEFTKNKQLKMYKIFEDADWLLVIPLSMKSSQIYGSGTKWCTSSREREYQFYELTNSGLLIYLINKKTSVKFAYFKFADPQKITSPGDRISQFYNAADCYVDSIDLDIPTYIYNIFREFIKNPPYRKNIDFPDYDKAGREEYLNNQKVCEDQPTLGRAVREEPVPVADPINMPAHGMAAQLLEDMRAGIEENYPLQTPSSGETPELSPLQH